MRQQLRCLLTIFSFSLLIGCSTIPIEPPRSSTESLYKQIEELTPPKRKVPITVYAFADLTGQRKPGGNIALISSAVTQGAHVWLVQSLKRAGEGVLIEGGIVGYDSNTRTGGVGARLLGIGIHDEFREDTVSVGLRLVSVNTGEVLIAVSAEKTIWSTRLSASVFKFIDAGTTLMEMEAGFSENESVSYAIRKAIDKAVMDMITAGAQQKLWEIKELQRDNGSKGPLEEK